MSEAFQIKDDVFKKVESLIYQDIEKLFDQFKDCLKSAHIILKNTYGSIPQGSLEVYVKNVSSFFISNLFRLLNNMDVNPSHETMEKIVGSFLEHFISNLKHLDIISKDSFPEVKDC